MKDTELQDALDRCARATLAYDQHRASPTLREEWQQAWDELERRHELQWSDAADRAMLRLGEVLAQRGIPLRGTVS